MARSIKKQALIGVEIILTSDVGGEIHRINPNITHNFIDIISLDGLGGNPVIPTTGTYEIFVSTTKGGGFKSLTDNGSLSAALTGGSALADGVAQGASFEANPYSIKIVPTGVDVAIAYEVHVRQNLT